MCLQKGSANLVGVVPGSLPHSNLYFGSTAAFVAHLQFWEIVGAMFEAISGNFGQCWVPKTARQTGVHAMSVTKAAVDPSETAQPYLIGNPIGDPQIGLHQAKHVQHTI